VALPLALLALLPLLVIIILVGVVAVGMWRGVRHRATRAGYESVGAYLRAAPQTDRDKQEAVDMALKGMVICALGLIFPPFLLVGLLPLFYGARKMAWASLGLGLADDPERPGA